MGASLAKKRLLVLLVSFISFLKSFYRLSCCPRWSFKPNLLESSFSNLNLILLLNFEIAERLLKLLFGHFLAFNFFLLAHELEHFDVLIFLVYKLFE